MKNILSILLVSMILFGCSNRKTENRETKKRIMSELTILKGLVYNEGELYTGEVWDEYNSNIWDKIDPLHFPTFDGLSPKITIGYNGYYKDGKRHGNWEYFDQNMMNTENPDGFVRYKETYKEGIIEEVLVWDIIGEKIRKERYKNRKRHGKWEHYLSDKDWITINYIDGLESNIKLFIDGEEESFSDVIIGGEPFNQYINNIKTLEGKSIL